MTATLIYPPVTSYHMEQVLRSHSEWLVGNPDGTRADLSGHNLSRLNLRGAILCRALLRGTDLTNTDLRYANLSGADLEGADLSRCNLNDAVLFGTNLRNTNLSDASFLCADLRFADLSDAYLVGALVDISALAMWCNDGVRIDDQIAKQIDAFFNPEIDHESI